MTIVASTTIILFIYYNIITATRRLGPPLQDRPRSCNRKVEEAAAAGEEIEDYWEDCCKGSGRRKKKIRC